RELSLTRAVRYDEWNCDGFLTPTAFLCYMQDIAAHDVEDAQLVGNGYWVIKRSVISFAAPVPTHTQLELKTFGIGISRITAQRRYEPRLADEHSHKPAISAPTL